MQLLTVKHAHTKPVTQSTFMLAVFPFCQVSLSAAGAAADNMIHAIQHPESFCLHLPHVLPFSTRIPFTRSERKGKLRMLAVTCCMCLQVGSVVKLSWPAGRGRCARNPRGVESRHMDVGDHNTWHGASAGCGLCPSLQRVQPSQVSCLDLVWCTSVPFIPSLYNQTAHSSTAHNCNVFHMAK